MNIEEQFFKAFGIEKIKYEIPSREYDDDGEICSYYVEEQYPEITAERLLELEDILLKHHIQLEYCFYDNGYFCSCTIPLCNGKAANKKDAFLNMLICIAENYLDNSDVDGEEEIYHQVRKVFEEE